MVLGSPKGRGRQRGEALYSLPPSRGTVAMVRASRAQSKIIAFRLENGVFISNFAEHFTENPRSRAARVSRKTDDSEAKMDKNPMIWQPIPFSHHAPCCAKLPKVNASTAASTLLETPMSMFITAMTPINSFMEEMYRGDLNTVEITKALQEIARTAMVHTPILISQLPNRCSQGLNGPENSRKKKAVFQIRVDNSCRIVFLFS